jgi:hypothetical protein
MLVSIVHPDASTICSALTRDVDRVCCTALQLGSVRETSKDTPVCLAWRSGSMMNHQLDAEVVVHTHGSLSLSWRVASYHEVICAGHQDPEEVARTFM